jgi:hypothetical protein
LSESLAEDMLLEYLNAVEMGIAAAKQRYKEKKGIDQPKPLWDMAKLSWEPAMGSAGPYERCENDGSLEFKAMLNDLLAHSGKLSKEGYFVWVFSSGLTVGRKKQQQTPSAPQQ